MSYYNTTKLTGVELNRELKNASSQESRILLYFRKVQSAMTPFQVHQWYVKKFKTNTPMTSIRRAMTSLSKKRVLLKLEDTAVKGGFGKNNHCWTLNQAL